jgi:DNA-binding HxlR family transcriptional regulator
MPRESVPRACHVAQALELVGERWSLLAMREILLGNSRFEGIVAHTGAPRNILSTRLSKLVEAGLLTRHRYNDRPPRDEYVPTAAGADLQAVILTLMAWGDRHLGDELPPPTVFEHTCGNSLVVQVACASCGEPADPVSLRTVRLGGSPV